jgi:hypothetical protein
MMKLGWQPRKWLEKKSKRGNRGYPMGTIAYYGPDNRRASKAAVSIMPALHADPADLRRWFAETGDLRRTRPLSPRSPHSCARMR